MNILDGILTFLSYICTMDEQRIYSLAAAVGPTKAMILSIYYTSNPTRTATKLGVDFIAKQLSISKSTVIRAVKNLVSEGYLNKTDRYNNSLAAKFFKENQGFYEY